MLLGRNMRKLVLAAALSLAACVSQEMAGYVGKDITEVFMTQGRPVDEFDLPDGNRAFQFYWGGVPFRSHPPRPRPLPLLEIRQLPTVRGLLAELPIPRVAWSPTSERRTKENLGLSQATVIPTDWSVNMKSGRI